MSKDTVWWTSFATPLGVAHLAVTRKGLCRFSLPEETRCHFLSWLHDHFPAEAIVPHPGPCMEYVSQLDEYFQGRRTRFDLHLDLRGTPFQQRVWQELLKIPYGKTTTYREMARRIGMPRAYQAVGGAIGQNPVLVVVPCHRVLGQQGSLTGYAAGITTKRWLLQHEGALLL